MQVYRPGRAVELHAPPQHASEDTPSRAATRLTEQLHSSTAEQLREFFQADGMISIHVQAIEEGPGLEAPQAPGRDTTLVHASCAPPPHMVTRAAKRGQRLPDFADPEQQERCPLPAYMGLKTRQRASTALISMVWKKAFISSSSNICSNSMMVICPCPEASILDHILDTSSLKRCLF